MNTKRAAISVSKLTKSSFGWPELFFWVSGETKVGRDVVAMRRWLAFLPIEFGRHE